MEKKTMGSFIAALRKANGMTQKDLAEKLNVSDKAVSRWERDENAPDLSLIPVIAEIFGITADELLRGQRNPVSEKAEETERTSANLGFLTGCIFYIAAFLCESIFYRIAVSSIMVTEISEPLVNECRKYLYQKVEKIYSFIIMVFAFSLPLVVCVGDAYMGIVLTVWLFYGILFAGAAFLLCVPGCWLICLQ